MTSTIVGYTYNADNYCTTCILDQLPTGEGEAFDGWADCSVPPMSAENNLTELAAAFGIDRDDEYSFDSSDFPKIVTSDMADDSICGHCFASLTD